MTGNSDLDKARSSGRGKKKYYSRHILRVEPTVSVDDLAVLGEPIGGM